MPILEAGLWLLARNASPQPIILQMNVFKLQHTVWLNCQFSSISWHSKSSPWRIMMHKLVFKSQAVWWVQKTWMEVPCVNFDILELYFHTKCILDNSHNSLSVHNMVYSSHRWIYLLLWWFYLSHVCRYLLMWFSRDVAAFLEIYIP